VSVQSSCVPNKKPLPTHEKSQRLAKLIWKQNQNKSVAVAGWVVISNGVLENINDLSHFKPHLTT